VLSDDYEFRTSTLQYDQATDEFYFHVKTRKIDTDGETVEIEVSDDTEHQTVLGIDLEELTDIRERLPHADWHHVWAFRRLVEYVEYKAPGRSVAVKQVEPDHTSRRCSHTDCGFTHEDNRDGEQFKCLKWGYEINADYNGAKNIGLRYMRKRQHRLRSSPRSGSADAPVDVRITGGILNGDGYRPTAES